MRGKNSFTVFILIFLVNISFAQEGIGTLYKNLVVHTGTGKVIKNGAVGVKNGLITYVGETQMAPANEYGVVIDWDGKDIYPGLIAMNTTLGLNEIFAVRATHDYREIGSMKPNVRAIIAYNAESRITETVLANGVLLAQICPRGGRIKGSSSVVTLTGWNWEDAAYKMDEGIQMDWPRLFKRKGKDTDPIAFEPDEEYLEEILNLKTYFREAQAYAKRKHHLEINPAYEAMRGVFNGEKRIYITADFIKEIREIIAFKRLFELKKVTIVGGYDSWMVADLLRENNISVLVRRVNSLPRFAEDAIDASFTLPSKLAKAEVQFSFQMAGGMETMQNRNLPFNIGSAIAYGLDREKALKAATLDAAEILGIAETTGSIETGKEANLIISEGDVFDMRTSIIRLALIKGEEVDLETNQDKLYKKYKAKYENQ